MQREPFYKHSLFVIWSLLLIVIAVLNIIAIEFFLYWIYSWFDILMHFLGGVFVGLASLWLIFESGVFTFSKKVWNITLTLVLALIFIGIGWEVFQVLAGFPFEDNYVLDTTIDIIADALGALCAGIFFTRVYVKNNNEEVYAE